jgi:exopolysaccharide production protein ExoY
MFHFSNLASSSQPAAPARRRYLETTHRIGIRIFDIVGSIAGIIFFAPLMGLIALLIYITSGGPIFFSQQRIGKCAKPFSCLKFRTMVVDAQERLEELLANDPDARAEWEAEHKLHNDPRITKLGAFLRRSSLDELPQFFNVLVGDMSLVGPRPIVLDEITRYGRYFGEYCRVRPGITGLWQVSGRNDVTYRRRVALDVSYVRSRRFLANFRILVLTVSSVLMARGSY